MTESLSSSETHHDGAKFRAALADGLRALGVVAVVCSLFTAVASLVLVLYTRAFPEMDFIQSPRGLLLRTAIFAVFSLVAAGLLWRYRDRTRRHGDLPPSVRMSRRAKVGLCLLVACIALVLGTRLRDYPWAAPDELHHLVVARNIAEYGAYASGHLDTGLNYFDSFDSVGPAVLGPVALAFKLFGAHLAVARGVMVVFFLALCFATYAFTRGLFGVGAGLVSVPLLVGTYSSVYLGRTLYGEVPAHLFLLLALLAWGKALQCGGHSDLRTTESTSGDGGAVPWGLLAGALVGFAILSKTILILVAFSFLGAWIHDRITQQNIGWRHVVYPCIGVVLVLGTWSLIQQFHGTGVGDSGGVLAIYQHYLLFGVGSVAGAFKHAVMPHPVAHVAWLAVIVISIPNLFHDRAKPHAIVLYLYAIFLLYWWFFFTPGHLHRYLWNAYAILAIFTAPWLLRAMSGVLPRDAGTWRRGLALVMLLALSVPGLQWAWLQTREILTNREMVSEYALVEAVVALPAGARVASDVGRVPDLINFITGQAVARGFDPLVLFDQYDAVITRDSPLLRAALPPGSVLQPAGPFVILSNAQTTE